MEGVLEYGREGNNSCSFAADEESPDALVRRNSARYRKKHASLLQETETDEKPWNQSTSAAHPDIGVGESEQSSSGSTIAIATSLGAVVRDSIESPLKVKSTPSVYYDKVQGVWKCHQCSWICPVQKPGVELIDKHKEHCQGKNNMQAWVEQHFPIEHDIQEGSKANSCFFKGGGVIESENAGLSEDAKMPKVIGKEAITKDNENQKGPNIEGYWQSNRMALEVPTEANIRQILVAGGDNHVLKNDMGTIAFQDYTKKELISFTSSQNRVIETREKRGTITSGGQDAPENAGIEQHQHGSSVSESVVQNSQNGFMREQDEIQLRDHWTTTLEKSTSTGNVEEEIVRVLKEQQSHDLLCPVCGSCVTKRVILRKRKRTSPVFVDGWYKETKDEVSVAASSGGLTEITEQQDDQPETQYEDNEETEAYGCLSCFSLFIRRVPGVQYFSTKLESGKGGLQTQGSSKMLHDSGKTIDKKKESFHCFPFLYPWGIEKEPESDTESVLAVKIPQTKSEQEAEVSTSNVENGNDLHVTIAPAGNVSTGTRIPDAIQQIKAVTEASTTSTGTESVLEDGEDKVSSVDSTDAIYGEGRNATAENGNSSDRLNYGYGPSKHEDAVEECFNRFPGEAKSNSDITHHNVNYETSITMTTITSTTEVVGGTGTKHITTEAVNTTQYLVGLEATSQLSTQHSYQQHVERGEEKVPELPVSGIASLDIKRKAAEQVKVGALGGYPSLREPDMPPTEIETKPKGEEIQEELPRRDQLSNSFNENTAAQVDEPNKGGYFCNCFPVSIQPIWSIWPSKEIVEDGQFKEPLLKESLDQKVPMVRKGSSGHGMLQWDQHYTRLQPSDGNKRKTILPVQPAHVESSSALAEQDHPLLAQSQGKYPVSHSPPLSPPLEKNVSATHVTVSHDRTIIDVQSNDDITPSVVHHVAQEQTIVPSTPWDILKSIVYGGLTVSITSLGVVSSAAGGEAKTLTVIAIGLANLVAGLFMLFNNIMDLRDKFADTIGHSFWFNGFVAVLSYLVFGSLAPIIYGFSFQRTDNRDYKFLTTSAVSLVSIILLSLGKAQVTTRLYFRTVSFYIITGFWASIIGYFGGEYVEKLLEKLGFKTDNGNAQKLFYY